MDSSSDNVQVMETSWSETDFDWEIGLAMDSDDEFLSALMVPLATSSPIRSPIASPAFTPQRLPQPSPLSPIPPCFSPGFLENYKLSSSCFFPVPEKKKHSTIELGSSPLYVTVSSGTLSPRRMPQKRPRDDSGDDEPRRRVRRRLTI